MTTADPEFRPLREKTQSVWLPCGVKRVAVFGLVARSEHTPGSDLDIRVTLPPPAEHPVIGPKWFGLIVELSGLLESPGGLLTEDVLSPTIRPFIQRWSPSVGKTDTAFLRHTLNAINQIEIYMTGLTNSDVDLGSTCEVVQTGIPPLKNRTIRLSG